MTEWYYAEGQQRHGPLPEQELRQRFQRGLLALDTLVWREGMGQWAELRTVTEELQLQTPAAAANTSSTGLDLRGDYAAIDNGTAPLPGSGPMSDSPYSAPASAFGADAGGMPVQGGEVVYAGFWKRVAAYMIDYVIVTIGSSIIGAILGLGLGFGAKAGFASASSTSIASQLLGTLIGIGIGLAYYGYFHSSRGGATPGKLAIGIKVVRTSGERLSLGRAIGRVFANYLSALTLGVGYIMAGFTERRQALHDLVCDTLVVDKWAFTDQPQLQRRELGVVTILVLVLGGLLILAMMVLLAVAIGIAVKSMS